MSLINFILSMVSILLSVAFFTLMERKFISFSQNRKGPNKTFLVGILQPISDAVKLLTKELSLSMKTNFLLFVLSPGINLISSLALWLVFPYLFEFSFMKMSTLFLMSCMTMSMMTIVMMSWSSNSNYAFIGMMRSISQLISYEINLIFVIICIINLTNQMNFKLMNTTQKLFTHSINNISIINYLNNNYFGSNYRTPFDFSEGESELISGFNIEYASTSFTLLFLSEYSSILIMSLITTLMFMNSTPATILFYINYNLLCFYFIWTRSTFPRFRYDKLMKFNWTQLLPLNTVILMCLFVYKFYCTMKN
uniref:NADH-ubiquinone oxidoreductase chain 1 n=1 Tax=Tetraleurodes acaciae TaxID=267835 RepID=Q6JCQ8_TETAA|nr:NADH dehydrogenase subunit 1 [Tetraleurodes acaciae]AAS77779.1 NADH dehydrogenase subunit 1 [Tetraleurodes acaciae]